MGTKHLEVGVLNVTFICRYNALFSD